MGISKRDKRFLMLGLSAVFIFILAQYVCIPFYNSEMEIREKIQLLELTNEKYTKILEKREDVVSKLNQLKRKESKTSNQLLLKGETTSLAAAEMQKMLEKLSSSSDIELKRVRVRDTKEIGDFLSIPVELRFTTDLKKMTDFLSKIKNSNKLITISRFKVSVKNRRDPKLLIVTMWANGFMEQPTETLLIHPLTLRRHIYHEYFESTLHNDYGAYSLWHNRKCFF